MEHTTYRSRCPINYSLQIVGDSWSLLILRDIVYFGKRTFGEFLASEEGIARNILAQRLHQLVEHGILLKRPHSIDRRKEIYTLTEKGIGLIPLLLDLADWGATHYSGTNAPAAWIELVRTKREEMGQLIMQTVREGGSIFAGEHSVISKLQS